MKRLNKTKSWIFILLHILYFQRQPFRFVFVLIAAGVNGHVVAVKCLPVLHSADYIFMSFGVIKPILVTSKI